MKKLNHLIIKDQEIQLIKDINLEFYNYYYKQQIINKNKIVKELVY